MYTLDEEMKKLADADEVIFYSCFTFTILCTYLFLLKVRYSRFNFPESKFQSKTNQMNELVGRNLGNWIFSCKMNVLFFHRKLEITLWQMGCKQTWINHLLIKLVFFCVYSKWQLHLTTFSWTLPSGRDALRSRATRRPGSTTWRRPSAASSASASSPSRSPCLASTTFASIVWTGPSKQVTNKLLVI